jgi:hypothetical protein
MWNNNLDFDHILIFFFQLILILGDILCGIIIFLAKICCRFDAEHIILGFGSQCHEFYWLLKRQPLGELYTWCSYNSNLHLYYLIYSYNSNLRSCKDSFLHESYFLLLLPILSQNQHLSLSQMWKTKMYEYLIIVFLIYLYMIKYFYNGWKN